MPPLPKIFSMVSTLTRRCLARSILLLKQENIKHGKQLVLQVSAALKKNPTFYLHTFKTLTKKNLL